MTPQELDAALSTLGWKGAELTRRAGVVANTVWRWRRGLTPIPPWVDEYLRAMMAIKALAAEFVEPSRAAPTTDDPSDPPA